MDALSARIAPHADACLTRFERFALDSVFARPAALDAAAAHAQEAAAATCSAEEEARLDAQLEYKRCRLAAVRRRRGLCHTPRAMSS